MPTEKTTKAKNTAENAAKKAVDSALNAADEMTAKSVEAVDTAIALSENAVKEGLEKASALTDEQSNAFQSGYTEALSFAQSNLETAFSAAKEANKGWNSYAQQIMNYTKKSFAENLVVAEKFVAAKTPEEFVDLQTEVAKTAATRISDQGTALSDIATKTAANVSKPIKAQAEKNLSAFAQ